MNEPRVIAHVVEGTVQHVALTDSTSHRQRLDVELMLSEIESFIGPGDFGPDAADPRYRKGKDAGLQLAAAIIRQYAHMAGLEG